jgi:tetratricopeptide (TPR) repeat protein
VDRIVRDRGSVGRRIWRRRRRRTSGDAAGDAHKSAPDETLAPDRPIFDEPEPAPAPATPQKRGLFGALFGKREPKKPPADPPYLVVDPTRDVLAVPRGAARLDAFERAIRSCPPGTPQFRALALAFHRELSALAEHAGVDLSLYESRVEACAQALIAAGEDERAGTLFLRVGRRHQAAELFVAAGAIDALEEAHAQIHWDEGGAKLEARLSFDRFEALFLVGQREQAFDALERAHQLWKDNPIYADVRKGFVERLGQPYRLVLTSGSQQVVVLGAWPVVIGRGEDAGVRLTSPLISRAHLQIELTRAGPVVVDLESRGGTRVSGTALVGRQPLSAGAAIDMGGVVVESRAEADGIWLTPTLAPERKTLAATSVTVTVPLPDGGPGPSLRFDQRGRAVLMPPAQLNGEAVAARPTILLEGDRVTTPTAAAYWIVAKRS